MSACETCRLVAFAIFSAAAGIGLEHGWRGFSLSMTLWALLFGGTLMQERWERLSTRTSHPDPQPTSIQLPSIDEQLRHKLQVPTEENL